MNVNPKHFLSCALVISTGTTLTAYGMDSMSMAGRVSSNEMLKSADEALQLGEYVTALRMFESGLSDKSISADLRAEMLLGASETYLWQGNFSDAFSSLKKALPLVNKYFGAASAQQGRALDIYAWLSQTQNKPDKAEEYCAQALAIRRRLPDKGALADSLEHMALLQENKGLYNEATSLYNEALTLRSQQFGPNSPAVGDLYDRLGAIAVRRGKMQEAQNDFAQANQIKQTSGACLQPYSPHTSDNTVVYRYYQGAPNCARAMNGGNLTERIVGDGVIVEASIVLKPTEFAKSSSADIRIINQNRQPVDILSQPASLVVLAPKIKVAQLLSGDRLAQDIEKKGESKAKWIRFWGADATTSVTSTVINPQPYSPWAWGYAPNPYGYPSYPPGWQRRGWMNNPVTTVTTQVPDWQKRAEALAKAQNVTDKSREAAQIIRQSALGPTTVPAMSTVQGTLNFASDNFDKALLRVPVGNAVFEFRFDKNQP